MKKENNEISFFNFIWRHKLKLMIVVILMFLYAVFENAVPYSMSFIIDNGLQKKSLTIITVIFAVLIIFGIVITLSQAYRDYLYLDFCSSYLKDLRFKIFSYLQDLSINFYSKTEPGDILSRFTADLTSIERSFNYAPSQLIVPVFSASITIILLFILNIPLACISMLIFPAFFLGPYFLTPRASKAGHIRKKSEASTISDVQTNISAQPVIKAFSLQQHTINSFEKGNVRLHKNMLKSLFLSSLLERSSITATIMLQVILLAVGTYMAFYGFLEVGELVAFQILYIGLTYNILYCSSYIPSLIQAKVGLRRIKTLMQESPQVEDVANAGELRQFNHEIQFKDVSFGYTEKQLNIHNLNITIPKGSSAAFVGESGCGKSTILNLLMRFYDVNRGSITIDKYNIRNVTQKSLRQQLGIVLQENILFNISIMDNIRLGKLNASEEEIFEAAKKAEIHKFIQTLPDGYHTLAGERGGKLSGGQKQRIAIARALVHGGNILILDEATSALDPVTQTSINKTIWKIKKMGITIISVTHHLASVIELDRIFVMNEGRVVEQGTHKELLAQNGLYMQMWNKQTSKKDLLE